MKKASILHKSVVVMLLLILPFNIIGIFTAVTSYKNSIKSAEDVIGYSLDSYAGILENRINNTNSALYLMTGNNESLLKICELKDDSLYQINRYKLFTDLSEQIRTGSSADAFILYFEKYGDYLQAPGYTAETVNTKPYKKYIDAYDASYTHWFLSEDNTRLIRLLHDDTLHIYYGAVIELNDFLQNIGHTQGYDDMSYEFNKEPAEQSASALVFNNEIDNGIYLTARVSSREVNQSISTLQFALILFFLLYFALIPLLIWLLRKNIIQPLKTLNQAQKELQNGNEGYQITDTANSSDFAYAYSSFNVMSTSIQELHAEVIKKELSNKQLQIDFLQLQIRPHFLLNSFNVLFTLIQRGQRESAQKMVLFLSDYFRYLFRSGRELQLFSKERKLIEDYMLITRIYYPVSFEISYQIDPILDLMRIPPLLLHSFLENIIAHALLPDRQVHIVFSGEYDDGIVTFYISDDGSGMDRDAREAINHAADTAIDDGKNVGIKNSVRRLKYYYGENASVICDSEPGLGTTFTITIPYDLEEK